MGDAVCDGCGPWFYAGIDEAGYGPVLGPLCVASSIFEMHHPTAPDGTAPDLWKLLGRSVSRAPGRTSKTQRLPIADSKVLKLPNPKVGAPPGRDPLVHLERGVLAMLHTVKHEVTTVDGLLEALEISKPTLPWYESDATREKLPRATTPEHIHMHGAHLAGVMESAGVRVRALRCVCIDERNFNAQLGEVGVKSGVSFRAVGELLREVWDISKDESEVCPRVVVDRQGGRMCYAKALAQELPGTHIEVLGETPTRSVYEVSGAGAKNDGSNHRMRIFFEVEAEQRHLPVALASMTAKLVRELMMARLNAHFGARLHELKPTAGYYSDGMRWLRDVDAILTPHERAVLRRKA